MKTNLTINDIKNSLSEIKGKNVQMLVNRGRKKTEKFFGEVQNLYPSVFTVKFSNIEGNNLATYSYTEVLCGHVKIMLDKK